VKEKHSLVSFAIYLIMAWFRDSARPATTCS